DALDQLSTLPYSIDDQPALTLMDIRTKARLVPGLKILFLDYLQLCVGDGDNRTAQIGAISRGLKGLAKEMGISIVALSQLNRKVEERPGKRPTLSDLRDSGEIEQDADVIWFLWPIREMGGRKLVGFEQAKNRQGRLMQVGLDFDGAHQRWGESTADISQDETPAPRRKGGFDE
ncbi:MAG: DnaB-like helicase C-terminal domain-containing protein, partial [Burkholderiales bacterium]|nr:DnaB-like helicase C-terminal domain-containing protein [Burkholderiales bacterium]